MRKVEIIDCIINDLDINYDKKDEKTLKRIVERLLDIASDFTNRSIEDEKIYSYIIEPAKAIYEQRGDEDKSSRSEGGISYAYKNAIRDMKKELVSIRRLP